MTGPTYSTAAIAELISPARLNPYLAETNNNIEQALELYVWATEMSVAAFKVLALFEVMLRNGVDRAMAEFHDEAAVGIPWFLLNEPLDDATRKMVDLARARLGSAESRNQVVANLSYGFWSGWFGSSHDDLWQPCLRKVFPNQPKPEKRKTVSTDLEAIRKLRNRLAHHDSVLNLDIPFELARVYRLAQYMSQDAKDWLTTVDTAPAVYARRPYNRLDTVVVPANVAWPFYQQSFAYVCQAGRFFRPVQRIAFYSGGAVQDQVPKIRYRRDDVVWTAANAQALSMSADVEDRKIAAVINASLGTGNWTSGRYQVFLLTRPGDPEHRVLRQPLQHQSRGRGAGFVRKQRYLSLHSLENATSTSDL